MEIILYLLIISDCDIMGFFRHLVLKVEDGGSVFIWNSCIQPQAYKKEQLRRLQIKPTLIWWILNSRIKIILAIKCLRCDGLLV